MISLLYIEISSNGTMFAANELASLKDSLKFVALFVRAHDTQIRIFVHILVRYYIPNDIKAEIKSADIS